MSARPDDPDLLYRAQTGGRWRWVVIGLAALMLGVGGLLRWGLGDDPLGRAAPYLLWPPALLAGGAALWRRGTSAEVRRHGIRLGSGNRTFGERQLVPWSSVTWFGGRRLRKGGLCLVFRQQHVPGDQRLPGPAVGEEEFHRLVDRLRVVLAADFPRLTVGGIE